MNSNVFIKYGFGLIFLLVVLAVGGNLEAATTDEIAAHLQNLRQKLPAEVYTIVSQPPFVIIGNEPADVVHDRATNTVGWAVARLKQDFFTNDPPAIIDLWMFKDQATYEHAATLMIGGLPVSPFGFYSRAHAAIIVNIGAGTGTLVHEIVHPFMHANFPECPPWLNEGLASLYEQPGERAGHIIGLTNWRLANLQRSIKRNYLPSIAEVTAMDEGEFYHQEPGENYEVARYLCYYLQEQGVLLKFYQAFRANHQTDPTGLKTLQQILQEKDLRQFQVKWETFVRKLTFP